MKKAKKVQLCKETLLRLDDHGMGMVVGQQPPTGGSGTVCSQGLACNTLTCVC